MNIIQNMKKLIKDNQESSFQSISIYILDNLKNLQKLDLKKISLNANVSTSTVTRYCKSFGFEGFKEFKEALKMEYKNNFFYEDKKIGENKESFLIALEKNIIFFKNHIDDLEEIARKITFAKNIYIYGFGGNSYIIKIFRNYLARIGIMAIYLHDRDDQLAYSKLANKDTLNIIVSYKFRHDSWKRLISNLRKVDSQIIFITKESNSPLFQSNDEIVSFPQSEGFMLNRDNAEVSMLMILILIVERIILNSDKNIILKSQDIL